METPSSAAMSSNMENIAPHVLRNVSKELVSLVRDPPEGITIINNEQDITDVQAIISGPGGTPYAGGKFHVRLVLSKEFPQAPPKGFFITKIFHPNVSINGEICVNTLQKDWKPDLGLKHVLLTIKCLLIAPNPESALNEEAGKLLLEQYDEYWKRAKMMTEVHAQSKKHGEGPSTTQEEPQSKKHAGDKRKTRILKEKKKILKRL